MKKKILKNGKSKFGKNTLDMVRAYFPKVTKVVDADDSALVEVTKVDMRNANPKSPVDCALALACERTFRADGVIIGLSRSYIIRGKTATRFKNSETISREITSFDRRAGFDIGYYSLSAPGKSERLDRPRPSGPKYSPAKGVRKPKFRHYTSGVRTLFGGVAHIS